MICEINFRNVTQIRLFEEQVSQLWNYFPEVVSGWWIFKKVEKARIGDCRYRNSAFATNYYSKEDFLKNVTDHYVVGNTIYKKPFIKVWFIDGGSQNINFETYEEAKEMFDDFVRRINKINN